jgi:hypothetical protein
LLGSRAIDIHHTDRSAMCRKSSDVAWPMPDAPPDTIATLSRSEYASRRISSSSSSVPARAGI